MPAEDREAIVTQDTEADQPWFVLRVKPRWEKVVAFALQAKRYQNFLPLYKSRRRWADRMIDLELPFFPGYVFCRFNPRFRIPILDTPGVVDILRTGSALAPVDKAEIAALQLVMQHKLQAEPWTFVSGQPVIIQSGPLKNLSGTVIEVRRSLRVVLCVTLLQRAVAVEVDADWLAPHDTHQVPTWFNVPAPAA